MKQYYNFYLLLFCLMMLGTYAQAQNVSRLKIKKPANGVTGVALDNETGGTTVFSVAGSEKMWLNSDDLSLKFVVPGSNLLLETTDLKQGSGYVGLSLKAKNTSNTASTNWTIYNSNTTSYSGFGIYDHTSNGLAADYRLFINDTDGNVGIGTSTPGSKLEVKGGNFWNGTIRANTNGTNDYSSFALYTNNTLQWSLYQHPSINNALLFHSREATDVMALTQDGKLGIGTTSPEANLHIKGTPRSLLKLYSNESGAHSNYYMSFWQGTGAGVIDPIGSGYLILGYDQPTTVVLSRQAGGKVAIGTDYPESYSLDINDISQGGNLLQLRRGTGKVRFLLDNGSTGKFYITRNNDPNAGIIIDPNGNVGIGRGYGTSINARLDVAGSIAVSGSTVHTSDVRFKKDIQTLTASKLAKLDQVRGTSYQFRTEKFKDKGFAKGSQMGVIAQELIKVYPELVTKGADGYYSVNYTGLIPVLVEAVKDLRKQNKELKAEVGQIKDVKAQNKSLEARLATLEKLLLKAKK